MTAPTACASFFKKELGAVPGVSIMDEPNPVTAPDSFLKKEAQAVGAVIGQNILRRYTVRRLLGVGAMGHVLQVRDIKTNEDAAIKCVPPQLATSDAHMRAI